MTAAGGYILAIIVAVVGFVCWWSADTDLRDHAERLAVIEAALRIGGVDETTQPLPAVSIRDARGAVAAAREANAPRPTPFPRTEGRHRAS